MNLNIRSFRNSSRRVTSVASLTSLTAAGLAIAVASGSVFLAGCGSSHSTLPTNSSTGTSVAAEKGSATITIAWPTRAASAAAASSPKSRLIPLATNSIVVNFVQNGTVVAEQIIARPTTGTTTTASFTGLTPGAYTVAVAAFASTDGKGVGLAGATTTTTVISAQTTTVSISLVSQVDHLNVSLPSTTLPVASVSKLTYSAVDASGNILPLAPSALTLKSSDSTVATIDANGNVIGVAAGTATITLIDTESGKSATLPVTVNLDYSYLPTTTVVNGQRVTFNLYPDGVEFYDITPGSGALPTTGQTLSVKYSGTLVDGTVFDSGSFSFAIHENQVIPGFDEGVGGMQVGTVRRIAIPASLAYGSNPPSGIPANATLIFDVTLVSIQ